MTEAQVNEAKWLVTHLLETNEAAAMVVSTLKTLEGLGHALPRLQQMKELMQKVREEAWSWHYDAKRLVDKLQEEV